MGTMMHPASSHPGAVPERAGAPPAPTPTPAVVLGLVLGAATLGFVLRLAYIDTRMQDTPSRRGGWRSRASIEAPLSRVAWLHDEQLYYLSTAVNAFRGRGFLPDYNTVQDGVYVPPPMQSLFVLSVFRAAGRLVEPFTLLAIQAVIATVMVVLAAAIGRSLLSWTAGVAFAFLVAVFPDFVYWSAYIFTESNYLAALALLVLLLIRWAETPRTGLAVAASLCLGLVDLQRANTLLLGPILAVFALATLRRRGFGSAVAFLLVPVLVLVPWLVRNLEVYGEPIWVSSNAGIHLYLANHPGLDPRQTPYLEQIVARGEGLVAGLERRLRDPGGRLRVTYYRYSRSYAAQFREYALGQPIHFARNVAIKFVNQFALVQDVPRTAWPVFNSELAYRILHRFVLVGGLLGLVITLRRRPSRPVALCAVTFAYFAAMGGLSILVEDGRYNVTLKFFLLLFLATGMAALRSPTARGASAGAARPTGREGR
jgi:4-amino-4-deoxy-L-arabinose transferase-like glycosyltransferase